MGKNLKHRHGRDTYDITTWGAPQIQTSAKLVKIVKVKLFKFSGNNPKYT